MRGDPPPGVAPHAHRGVAGAPDAGGTTPILTVYQVFVVFKFRQSVYQTFVGLQKSSDGGSVRGRQTLRVLRHVLDQTAARPSRNRHVNILGDAISTQRTPIRFPSIMSKFRSVTSGQDF